MLPVVAYEPVLLVRVVISATFPAMLVAIDAEVDVKAPDISEAIWAELDNKVLLNSDSAVVILVLNEALSATKPATSEATEELLVVILATFAAILLANEALSALVAIFVAKELDNEAVAVFNTDVIIISSPLIL